MSEETLIFRKGSIDDVAGLVRLEKSNYLHPWPEAQIKTNLILPLSYTFVLDVGGEIVGAIYLFANNDEAFILNLSVAKKFRRQGLGRRLLKESIAILKKAGVSSVKLCVRTTNQGAIELYQGFGFYEIRRVKDYYTDGKKNEDAIEMSLRIKPFGYA